MATKMSPLGRCPDPSQSGNRRPALPVGPETAPGHFPFPTPDIPGYDDSMKVRGKKVAVAAVVFYEVSGVLPYAKSIAEIGVNAVPDLISKLQHQNAAVRRNVIWALEEIGPATRERYREA